MADENKESKPAAGKAQGGGDKAAAAGAPAA